MKKFLRSLCVLVCLFTALGFAACGGEKGSSSSSIEENSSSSIEENVLPTRTAVVQARKNVLEAETEGYNFSLSFGGTLDLLGISGTASADYTGKYRHNKTTNEVQFQRTTSGLLLYDSTSYVYTKGAQKIQVKMNDQNEVKKVSVLPNNDEDVTLINKPIVAIVDALQVENLGEIEECESAAFDYQVNMNFSSDNATLSRACAALANVGTTISMKGVEVSNPFGGIQLLFNVNEENKLEDFKLSANLSFPVKGSSVSFALTYEQHGAKDALTIPATSGLIMDTAALNTEIAAINNSLQDLKNDSDYSLDLLAQNELDPAWNKLAIVDKYTGRLYKNTSDEDEGKVWFNHSYKYKSHTEEDGAESFEYAIGNMTTGEVYLASYKGDNTYTLVTDKTVDTQFDYMLAPVMQETANIDCIKKVNEDTKTTYYLYLNQAGTASVQKRILDIVNSNTATGVTKVENYFSQEYFVKEAEIVVEVVNGKVVNVKCLTEISYCPTAGEYTEYNVTLTNTIELKVNDKLSAAQGYTAPNKPDGWVDNLESVL